jgi:ADP-ribose pyrophosphatase YjhB (NUDIX family)
MGKAEIRILKENLVYQNGYGSLYDDDVKFYPYGNIGKYVRWKWTAPYSVAVLAIQNNKAVLIESFRHSAHRVVLETVKGFGEIGVDPIEIASKELAEEAQLKGSLVKLGVTYTDPAFSYHPMFLFLAMDCEPIPGTAEETEVITRVQSISLSSDISELAQKTNDAVTLLLLVLAKDKTRGKNDTEGKTLPN